MVVGVRITVNAGHKDIEVGFDTELCERVVEGCGWAFRRGFGFLWIEEGAIGTAGAFYEWKAIEVSDVERISRHRVVRARYTSK